MRFYKEFCHPFFRPDHTWTSRKQLWGSGGKYISSLFRLSTVQRFHRWIFHNVPRHESKFLNAIYLGWTLRKVRCICTNFNILGDVLLFGKCLNWPRTNWVSNGNKFRSRWSSVWTSGWVADRLAQMPFGLLTTTNLKWSMTIKIKVFSLKYSLKHVFF